MIKMKYYAKSIVFWCFTCLIEFPVYFVFMIKRGLDLYNEDPNILLDEYLREKYVKRLADEFLLTKIGSFGDRLCSWSCD